MGNALVEMESQFPFNVGLASARGGATGPGTPAPTNPAGPGQTGPLFGIGRSLYFCVAPNPALLRYWETVADRLFKIRHCENLQGAVQPLPLFDPPLDPGMLVKAAAAGVDIGSIVSGLNQPSGPVRCLTRIQKALELCGELRSLGAALLSAIEKGDGEELARLRQTHEISLQQMTQNVRFLQWKQAQEATAALLRTRATTLERYRYYLRLLGLTPDNATTPDTFPLDRSQPTDGTDTFTEETFDDTYAALVGQYDQPIGLQPYPRLHLIASQAPASQSGASGTGQLYLNANEDAELNTHLPRARDIEFASTIVDTIASGLALIPDIYADFHWWGIGGSMKVFGGSMLSEITKAQANILREFARVEQEQGAMAARAAGYQRRADDWLLQANLAARELMQIGRQIISSLISEQVTYHDYTTAKKQASLSGDVLKFMETKFSSTDLYNWMQGQLSSLYYQYYRFALDTSRKAEQTMKRELMRPEVDATTYIQPNYWDSGHQGLLSGETLYLDLKRMEIAYHDNNKRELELTRHVSLRQLDPLALLSLKITGSCNVTIPEALYDRDCPGHYLRRIKNVGISIPSVVGPYTSINATLTLQHSTVRVSPLPANGPSGPYARDPANPDDRFTDYFGSVESIVTSGAANDTGMFETNLKDDRFLPFEGAGACSTWSISLPGELRPFDYTTISDVILHVRYTARDGGADLAKQATDYLKAQLALAEKSQLALLFSLRYDFPTEWSAFVNGASDYTFTLRKEYFPYMVQGLPVTIDQLVLYAGTGQKTKPALAQATQTPPANLASDLNGPTAASELTFPADQTVLIRTPEAQVFLVAQYHLG